MRRDYTLVLELRADAPIVHGAGQSRSNITSIRTAQYAIYDDSKEEWREEVVPIISGASLKSKLREAALTDALGRAGIVIERDLERDLERGDVTEVLHTHGLEDWVDQIEVPDDLEGSALARAVIEALREAGAQLGISNAAHRLLSTGGVKDSSSHSVSLDKLRELEDLFPILRVFGCLDNVGEIKGMISVADVVPWVETLYRAGHLPTHVAQVGLQVGDDEDVELAKPASEEGQIFAGMAPIPRRMLRDHEQHFRHGRTTRESYRYVRADQTRALEDKKKAVKSKGRKASDDERRQVSESMPHRTEAIRRGTPLLVRIRLHQATEVEYGCLLTALTRWIATGATLGGRNRSKGNGACSVRKIHGYAQILPTERGVAVPPSTALTLASDEIPEQAAVRAYHSHVRTRAGQIRDFLGAA